MSPSSQELPNPYDWRRHRPRVEILRPNVEEVALDLCRGGSGILVAGRGLGKSVFLRQVHAALRQRSDVLAVLLSAPPPSLTVEAMIRALARKLGVALEDPMDTHEVMQAHLASGSAKPRVVLLYDELDRYGRRRDPALPPPGRDFFNNLESMRRDLPEVGILAAGSIGVFTFRDALGSSFVARANRVRLAPFGPPEVARLARPFAERGQSLDDECTEAVELLTGGNPALVTYAFQELWSEPRQDAGAVAAIFRRFRRSNEEFLRDFQLSFAAPELSQAPQRIWELVSSSGGEIRHAELERAAEPMDGTLKLEIRDVLDLLEAAGLVRITGSIDADPVRARPVAGILGLPRASQPIAGLRNRLRADLELLMARLHAAAADFFRPGGEGEGKKLVPESVFSGFLALGFDLLGWQADREVQRGAGRTDLRMRWNGSEEHVLVEVKIWGRHDFQRVHQQVLDYWTAGARAAAVVMITDADLADWPAVYSATCLVPQGVAAEAESVAGSPVRARFAATSRTSDELLADVDHYLLRLPRRR